jgi:uncharacterized membrane protein YuzA (DUF378 family)
MSYLENIYEAFDNKIDKFLDAPQWKTKIVWASMVIMLLSFFTNFSPLRHIMEFLTDVLKNHKEYYIYQTIKDRAASITHDWTYPLFTGMNNRTFRLTLPLFVKIFHIQRVSVVLYALQLILGVVYYYLLTNFFGRYIKDKPTLFYTLIALACIYVGTSFFIDIATFGDFFSYFFLFLAIYYRNPLLVFLFLSLAFWNDERTFVGSGFVFLWWWLSPQIEKDKPFKITINFQMIATIAAWAMYWIVRKFYLVDTLGMKDTYKKGEFWEMFEGSWSVYGFKFFWAYEFWWLLLLLAFLVLFLQKDFLRLTAILGATLLMNILSLTTYDSTRSGSFGFIGLFLALIIVQKNLSPSQFKRLMWLIAIGCFLHPLATRTNGVGFFLM